eukprot:296441-Hanusia_phi.AAC.1
MKTGTGHIRNAGRRDSMSDSEKGSDKATTQPSSHDAANRWRKRGTADVVLSMAIGQAASVHIHPPPPPPPPPHLQLETQPVAPLTPWPSEDPRTLEDAIEAIFHFPERTKRRRVKKEYDDGWRGGGEGRSAEASSMSHRSDARGRGGARIQQEVQSSRAGDIHPQQLCSIAEPAAILHADPAPSAARGSESPAGTGSWTDEEHK